MEYLLISNESFPSEVFQEVTEEHRENVTGEDYMTSDSLCFPTYILSNDDPEWVEKWPNNVTGKKFNV